MHHVIHNIEADAAPGNFRHLLRRRKARQKKEFQEFRLGEMIHHVGVGQAFAENFLAQPVQINSSPVVRDRNQQHP